jgi:hypothetical protein
VSDVLANIPLYVYRYVTKHACESIGKNVTFVTFVTEKGGFPTYGQYPGDLEAPMTKPITPWDGFGRFGSGAVPVRGGSIWDAAKATGFIAA